MIYKLTHQARYIPPFIEQASVAQQPYWNRRREALEPFWNRNLAALLRHANEAMGREREEASGGALSQLPAAEEDILVLPILLPEGHERPGLGRSIPGALVLDTLEPSHDTSTEHTIILTSSPVEMTRRHFRKGASH
jgi:hypothetical protein